MTNQNHRKERKSPRASFHDYSGGGYFVTICTADKEHYFGEVKLGEMRLSEIGQYCDRQLEELNCHYPYAEVLLWVVMPNHVHAIIHIDPDGFNQGTHEPCVRTSLSNQTSNTSYVAQDALNVRTHGSCVPFPTERTALGVVIGGLKRAVTMYARRHNIDFAWHGRYHDHIIRNSKDGNLISEYILNNPATWANDCFAL